MAKFLVITLLFASSLHMAWSFIDILKSEKLTAEHLTIFLKFYDFFEKVDWSVNNFDIFYAYGPKPRSAEGEIFALGQDINSQSLLKPASKIVIPKDTKPSALGNLLIRCLRDVKDNKKIIQAKLAREIRQSEFRFDYSSRFFDERLIVPILHSLSVDLSEDNKAYVDLLFKITHLAYVRSNPETGEIPVLIDLQKVAAIVDTIFARESDDKSLPKCDVLCFLIQQWTISIGSEKNTNGELKFFLKHPLDRPHPPAPRLHVSLN